MRLGNRRPGAGVHLPAERGTVETLGAAVNEALARGPDARELRGESAAAGAVAATAAAIERAAPRLLGPI